MYIAIMGMLEDVSYSLTFLYLINLFFSIVYWKVFSKAGQRGWKSLIPIYNIYIVVVKICKEPWWWVVLLMIPVVNIVAGIIIAISLGRAFGKSATWSFFLLFLFNLIGPLILGFGSAQYKYSATEDHVEVAPVSTEKRGFWYRLFHNRLFWVGVAGCALFFLFVTFLIANYTPPFPPHWIGVKYYSFDVNKPITLDQLKDMEEELQTVQTALLVFEPKPGPAENILPEKITVNLYTLTNEEVIKSRIQSALANNLSGISSNDQSLASQILNDPLSYIDLKKVALAVTQVNNFTADQNLFIENLEASGKEVDHKVYEDIQNQLQIAPEVTTLPAEQSSDQNIKIEKRGIYRVYENDEAKEMPPSNVLISPYDSFILINSSLYPTKNGRSNWLVLNPGEYDLPDGASVLPIRFYHAVQTVQGIPFYDKSVGHGWTSVSFEENGIFYPLMTESLFNSIDYDNELSPESGEVTNIATYTNLHVNQPDDWLRSWRSLNRIPLPDGPSRSRLNEITPEEARNILLLRAWYLPQYSTQEYYKKYLVESFKAASNPKDKAGLFFEIIHVNIENFLNNTFWGVIQAWMSNTTDDTRYNGITSNCVAYSVALWNALGRNPEYDPRMLKLVAVPGKLYEVMNPDEVITLPDAETLPVEQQGVPYYEE